MKRVQRARRKPAHVRPTERARITIGRRVQTPEVLGRRFSERHYALASRFGPDPAHLEALEREHPMERLAAWPRGRHAPLILRTIQAAALLELATGVVILLLVHEPGLD